MPGPSDLSDAAAYARWREEKPGTAPNEELGLQTLDGHWLTDSDGSPCYP